MLNDIRIAFRNLLLQIMSTALDLRAKMIDVSEAHVETLRDASAKSSLAESISAEVLWYFKKLVAKLPKAYRRVVLLRVLEELSYSEISKRLKIPKGTVMSRLFRVRQKLWRLVDYLKAE